MLECANQITTYLKGLHIQFGFKAFAILFIIMWVFIPTNLNKNHNNLDKDAIVVSSISYLFLYFNSIFELAILLGPIDSIITLYRQQHFILHVYLVINL